MNRDNMARRAFLAGSAVVLAACRPADGEYFGNTTPPAKQRLVFENISEPETLDPAKTQTASEERLLPSMFEGLTTLHPVTMEAVTGMATHYTASPDFTRFTFYLRGHPNPSGIRLPDASSLTPAPPPPDNIPARWSDGGVVTAHDFLYSWRRAVAPETAAGFGIAYFNCIENAAGIIAGKIAPAKLGVTARDDFAISIQLCRPAPYFPSLLWTFWFCPVPARAIESAKKGGAEALWMNARNIIVNGPFTLARWRPNDYVVLRKNPRYYARSSVRLEEICFLPSRDEPTMLSLYKAGLSHAIPGKFLTPEAVAGLRGKRDLKREPAARISFYSLDSLQPPFDTILVRYALNMALDKKPIAAYLAGGQLPAAGVVPPMRMFPPLQSLPVTVDGQTYDVLSSDPAGARTLLAKAGYTGGVDKQGKRISFKLTINQRPRALKTAEILQAQWRQRLGIEVMIGSVTESIWTEAVSNKRYSGMIEDAWTANYLDPNDFLEMFGSPGATGATWTSASFDGELERANAAPDATERLHQLAEAERTLMRVMPIVPLYFDSFSFLQKPFVRGLWNNPGDVPLFKYTSIDTNWRPS